MTATVRLIDASTTSTAVRPNNGSVAPCTTYDQLVERSAQGSIYCRPWWLEAVAPGRWRILEIRKGGTLQAAWPVVTRWVDGQEVYEMPPLSQKLGILFAPSDDRTYPEQLSHEHQILEEFLAQLPDRISFVHRFHENFTNWLPFHWSGFTQTTRYTYLLPALQPIAEVWEGMRSVCRRNIRKATKLGLRITDDLPIERFAELHDLVFRRQQLEPPLRHDLLYRLDDACLRRGCRKIFAAVDSQDRVHAAAYVVWDSNTAYYLIGGSDPELRDSGGLRLAQWEAIQFSATVARRFDFEGSMIRGVETACRSFGARQIPYFSITKRNMADPRPRFHPRRAAAGVLRRIADLVDPPRNV